MSLIPGLYAQIKVDKTEIDQSLLDIEKKTRSNPLKWNGQFSPQLVSVLLRNYSNPGDIVFDPFLGSGTLLLEAGLARLSAFGTEVNPAAVILSRIYGFINVPLDTRKQLVNVISNLLDSYFPILPLITLNSQEPIEIKARLREAIHNTDNEHQALLLEALVVSSFPLTMERLLSEWQKLKKLVFQLPFSEKALSVLHTDARKIPLNPESIDLVITSPPYINVFNYHQQYRTSVEFLDWDLLTVAKSEIGANRKHRANRFLTVIQYCLDIAMTLQELRRICRPDARLIFVVGRQSNILATPFYNGEIVTQLAHQVLGFDLRLRQERVFRNRFGKAIFEDILHFSPGLSTHEPVIDNARKVARSTLENAYDLAPDRAKQYLAQACEKLEDIEPSPLFVPDRAMRGKSGND